MSGASLTFDLILRDDEQLDAALVTERSTTEWPLRLLGVSALGLASHGLAVGVVARAMGEPTPLWVPGVAMVGSFIGALAICLPGFYVYTRLAGLAASFRLVVVQALRAQARVSILLVGLTPLYVALGLAPRLDLVTADQVLLVGHVIPFAAAVTGLVSLYRSFGRIQAIVPTTRPLRPGLAFRLTVGWGGFLAAVAPVAYVRFAWWLTTASGG